MLLPLLFLSTIRPTQLAKRTPQALQWVWGVLFYFSCSTYLLCFQKQAERKTCSKEVVLKVGYMRILVYAQGMPVWKESDGRVAGG
ncbi:hypothetical protein VU04_12410 [Desulfobulbus sp. TB]|nr:hypothetical protein [Desulfobulbus sp. TB]